MNAQEYEDPNPEYWQGHSNLQCVKHALIREYLNGWFPKLGFWAGRILYVDTHAGRGRHETGEMGSPLVALSTFLSHRSCDQVLTKSEVRFIFVEHDSDNLLALQRALAALGPLLKRVEVETHLGDSVQVLSNAVAALRTAGQEMAPAFVFVDPYGFKVPYSLLHELMRFERVELLVNVMWRYLYMGLGHARSQQGMAATMDFVFGGPAWRQIGRDDFEQSADQTLSLIAEKVAAKWATPVRMLGENGATEYILLHLTNHDEGRDLMKEVRWKVCPSYGGRFIARKSDDPAQLSLGLQPEPDWAGLEQWVMEKVKRPMRWQSLLAAARSTDWLAKHVNQAVSRLRGRGVVGASRYAGRFAVTNNPLLCLNDEHHD